MSCARFISCTATFAVALDMQASDPLQHVRSGVCAMHLDKCKCKCNSCIPTDGRSTLWGKQSDRSDSST